MRNLCTLLLAATLLLGACSSLQQQAPLPKPKDISKAKNDSERYLLTYYPMAVEQMEKYGIPASITLAQGLLESGAGKSKLSVEGNNHFGIKADKRWKGKTITSFDNGNWHKFRRYNDPAQSYEDHSKFLRENSRYDALFKLKKTDYKGWAKGLKKAYYAEDRQYDSKLIGIIEKYGLHKFDQYTGREAKAVKKQSAGSKEILRSNGLLYVFANEGDTFKSLSKELNISKRKLRKYNDLYKEYRFKEGDIVYLERKNNKATKGYNFHTTKEGESLYRISQLYGIKLKKLYDLNPQYRSYTKLKVGDVVRLR